MVKVMGTTLSTQPRRLTTGRGLLAMLLALVIAGMTPLISACTPAASNGVDNFRFTSLDVVYTLGRDEEGVGTLRVEETFVAQFPAIDQNRGMRRSIPDSYQGAPLFPTLISLTDGEGNPRPVETGHNDGYWHVTSRADEFLRGTQTFVLTYEMRNVILFPEDASSPEFYWDVNGVEWRQPFGRVTATVIVPPELAERMWSNPWCYAGPAGSRGGCSGIEAVDSGDGGAQIHAEAVDLGPRETMTLVVQFWEGTFTPFDSSYVASPWGWLQALMAVAIVAWGGVVVWIRRRFHRDAPGRPSIIAEYEPPEGLDALEASVLLRKGGVGVTAEILEQAVVGSLRIVEKDNAHRKKKYALVLVDPTLADENGAVLLKAFFPSMKPGTQFALGTANTRVAKSYQRAMTRAKSRLKTLGFYRTIVPRIRGWLVLAGVVLISALVLFGAIGITRGIDPVPTVLTMLAGIVAVLVVFALFSSTLLTAVGSEARDHLEGLRIFIEWAEADRIRMLQSPEGAERVRVNPDDPYQMLHLYERLLPYAVVFGQEKEWAKKLAVMYEQHGEPTWYFGGASFSATSFSASIVDLTGADAPSVGVSGGGSSSFSGFGGRGSAGGGGGGGGGGGV